MALPAVPGVAKFRQSSTPFAAGNYAYLITATSSGAAHTLYTAASSGTDLDYVQVWVKNNDAATRYDLTLEVGGVTVGPISVGASGFPALVFPFRQPLENGNTIKAYASGASKLVVGLSVTRISDAMV